MHQALRRNQPARNPREGVLQYIKKERKKDLIRDRLISKGVGQNGRTQSPLETPTGTPASRTWLVSRVPSVGF